MTTPATQERTTQTPVITAEPKKQVAPQRHEIPDSFSEEQDISQVSSNAAKGFWSRLGSNVVRWSDAYAEFKLSTGYYNQFRI